MSHRVVLPRSACNARARSFCGRAAPGFEVLLPKRRILELYANVIEMGDGIYGVAAAARCHFRHAPGELTREQLVTLAALLPNPRRWDPAAPSGELQARKRRILRQEPAFRFALPSAHGSD
jgi:monofunctional glycosyltransferase